MLITGGTGSGKTTLLNILSRYIPDDERIVTIEDSAELQLQQPHVVRLETRPPNIEGKGQITQRDLVRNALRMRPDRIVVGEVRGDEVLDMLQAMNTGHDGSLTTLHANSAARRAAPAREPGADGRPHAARPRHPRADRLGARASSCTSRASRTARARSSACRSSLGMEGRVVTMQEIFRFVPHRASTRTAACKGHFEADRHRAALLRAHPRDRTSTCRPRSSSAAGGSSRRRP